MATTPYYVGYSSGLGEGAVFVFPHSSTVENDLLVLIVSSANETVTTPAGWTLLSGTPQATGTAGTDSACAITVFYKFAAASEGYATVADSGAYQHAIMTTYRGVDLLNPINASAGTVNATAVTDLLFPGVTTTVDGCLVVNAYVIPESSSASVFGNAKLDNYSIHGSAGFTTGSFDSSISSRGGVMATAGDTTAASKEIQLFTAQTNGLVTFALTPTTTPEIHPVNGSFTLSGQYTRLFDHGEDQSLSFDLHEARYVSTSATALGLSYAGGIFWKDDGSKLYAVGFIASTSTIPVIREFDVSPTWSTNLTFNQQTTLSSVGVSITGIFISSDGSKLFVSEIGATDYIHKFTFGTAWDSSTLTYDSSLNVSSLDSNPHGVYLSSDGNTLYFAGSTNDDVFEVNLPTAWSFSGASLTTSVAIDDGSPLDMSFSDDRVKLFVAGDENNKIYQYRLAVAGDLTSTLTLERELSVSNFISSSNAFTALAFGNFGEDVYVASNGNKLVYRYSLTPLDITADYGSFSLSGQSVELDKTSAVVAEFGSFVLTGQTADDSRTYRLNQEYATFSLTGQDAALDISDPVLEAEYGSFTLTGRIAELRPGFKMTADEGSFTLTGQVVTLKKDSPIEPSYGSFTLTGQDAEVIRVYVSANEYGSFTITDNFTELSYGKYLTVDYGAFTLTGEASTLATGTAVTVDYGAFTLTGQDASSLQNYIFSLSSGSFILTGYSFSGSPAAITVTGHTAAITIAENPKISREAQKFSVDNVVELFELDCSSLGGDVLRFTGSAWATEAIQFGGETYTPIPIEADGFEVSGRGVLPTPTLRVLNTSSLQSSIIALDDLLGATVRRIKTFRTFLDQGDTPDPNAHFPIDVYKVDRKVSSNKVYVEWELAASIDQEGRMIPSRQVMRNYCTQIYRRYDSSAGEFVYTAATCPYAGSSYYNEKNELVTDPAQDRCGKLLSSCTDRFGENAELPFRGFPGVSRIR